MAENSTSPIRIGYLNQTAVLTSSRWIVSTNRICFLGSDITRVSVR
jgi:hypothetical protein